MRAALVTCALLISVGGASANPFYIGRYRGLLGGALDDSAFAVYWNPAGLADTQAKVNIDLQLISRQGTFDKFAEENGVLPEEVEANAGYNETGTTGAVPAVAGSFGFALGDFVVGFGGAGYVERAGTTNWKKNLSAPAEYPGAIDGPQRWATINTTLVIFTAAAGFGIEHRPSRISIGVAPQWNYVTLSTIRARNLNRDERLVQPDGRIKEGRILLEEATTDAFTFVAGLRWDATDDLAVGASFQLGNDYILRGKARIQAADAPEAFARARFPLQVGDVFRATVAWRIIPLITLRPEFEWANWSRMDRQVATNDVDCEPSPTCARGAVLLAIERDFQDTYTGRLRADFHVEDWLTFHAGFGYETGATPVETHEPGLAENDSFEIGTGVSVVFTEQLALSGSFIWHQFLDQTVHDSVQQPTVNGVYTDQRQYFNLNLEVKL